MLAVKNRRKLNRIYIELKQGRMQHARVKLASFVSKPEQVCEDMGVSVCISHVMTVSGLMTFTVCGAADEQT